MLTKCTTLIKAKNNSDISSGYKFKSFDSNAIFKNSLSHSLPNKFSPVFKIKTCQLAVSMGLGSIGLLLPLAGNGASVAQNLQPIPTNTSSTLPKSIEQQQIWQDALKQQRIESLTGKQVEELLSTQPVTPPNIEQTSDVNCLSVERIDIEELPQLNKFTQKKLRQQAEKISTGLVSLDKSQNSINYNETKIDQLEVADNNQCVTVSEANALIRNITQAYLDEGYFKTSIKEVSKDSTTAKWKAHVAEISAIDNQTELPTNRLFGNVINKPANISILDQAVSNAERVIDGKLLLDVYPVGEEKKNIRLKVTQQGEIDEVSGDLEWRYNPNDSYGHNEIKLGGKFRNVMGQADLTAVSVQQSLTNEYGYDDDNQRRSASIYSIVPNGKWQLSGLLAADEYTKTTPLPNSTLKQKGDSWQANLRLDYTFDRDQDSISTVYGQLAHNDNNSEILGSKIDIQSPTISSARIGANHTKLFNKRSTKNPKKVTNGAWVVDLSVEQGLGNHDNPATKQGLSDDYQRFILSGYLSHQHSLSSAQKQLGYWQATHQLEGQLSNDQLFGINQQSLGSTSSGVRGINNTYYAAETGVTLRNTLSFEPLQSKWLAFDTHKIRWSPYIGADYGIVKDSKTLLKEDKNDASSATIGLKLIGYDAKNEEYDKKWQLDVNASRARVDYADDFYDGTQDTEVAASWKWYF